MYLVITTTALMLYCFIAKDFNSQMASVIAFSASLFVRAYGHSDKYAIMEETTGKLAQDIVDLRGQISIMRNRLDR